MKSLFPSITRLAFYVLILGFISFCIFYGVSAKPCNTLHPRAEQNRFPALDNRTSNPLKDTDPTTTKSPILVQPQRDTSSQEPGSGISKRSKEIDRDGRFIAFSNGTVLDTRTGLMWAAADNGEDSNWHEAKEYCENYLGGWYDDWRMPTLFELAGIYNSGAGYSQDCCSSCSQIKITQLIKLTCCCLWALETDGSGAAHFVFHDGFRGWNLQSDYVINRVLPVRSGSEQVSKNNLGF